MKKKQETLRSRVTVTVSVEMQFELGENHGDRFESIRESAESAAEDWMRRALEITQREIVRVRQEKGGDAGWPYPEMDERPRARCTSIAGRWEEKDVEKVECEECGGTGKVQDDDCWIPAEDGAMRCRTCRYPAPTHKPGCRDDKTKRCPECPDKLAGA